MINCKIVQRILTLIILLSIIFIFYGLYLPAYTDKTAFDQITSTLWTYENKTAKYFEIRDQYLTKKYVFLDFGYTFLLIAGLIWTALKWIPKSTPLKKLTYFIIGLLAAVTTVVAYIVDLSLGITRDEYPPWGDSMGIPLMGVPSFFIILFLWMVSHLAFLYDDFKYGINYSEYRFKRPHLWLFTLCVITTIFLAVTIAGGDFLYIPGLSLWIYFYFSLLIGKSKVQA